MSLPVSGKAERVTPKGIVLVDQQDLYTNIFSNFPNCDNITDQYIVIILTEYIRSLTQFQIPVQHYIYELVIHAMVRQKAFYQLHQFLQYHVVTDSKPLVILCNDLLKYRMSLNYWYYFICLHLGLFVTFFGGCLSSSPSVSLRYAKEDVHCQWFDCRNPNKQTKNHSSFKVAKLSS